MTALEREIRAKLEQAKSLMLGGAPAATYNDYLIAHTRLAVLRELEDFIAERKKQSASPGDLDDDE